MSERLELLRAVRELIELDRGFGVEFVPRATPVPEPVRVREEPPPAAPAAPTPAPAPLSPAPAPIQRAAPPAPAPATPAAIPAPAAPPAGDSMAGIAAEVSRCRACRLCETRTTTVPGEGSLQAELLFVGEGPGADEDAQGRPFVGAAGQLLDKMIAAMGFRREDVFIANVVKCRPPGNRNPETDEVAACVGYLHRQIAALKPRIICTLGNVPLRALFGPEQPGITRSRGRKLLWHGTPVIPTFHPSYLLRNEQAKKPAWEDLCLVLREMGREPPKRAR
jgi:DNA polymerase